MLQKCMMPDFLRVSPMIVTVKKFQMIVPMGGIWYPGNFLFLVPNEFFICTKKFRKTFFSYAGTIYRRKSDKPAVKLTLAIYKLKCQFFNLLSKNRFRKTIYILYCTASKFSYCLCTFGILLQIFIFINYIKQYK